MSERCVPQNALSRSLAPVKDCNSMQCTDVLKCSVIDYLAVRSLAWLRIVMSSITGMVLVMLERVRADSGVITLL